MLQTFSLHLFTEHLNSSFRLPLNDGQFLELALTEATDLGSNARQDRFALTFRGPDKVYLPQRTYRLEHDALGSLDLFLVPVARDGEAYLLEAAFNLLVGTP